MTNRNYYTETYKPDHTKYGGRIYNYDFDTDYRREPGEREGSDIAKRIATDMKFDEQCKRNLINKKHGHGNYSWNRKEK